MSLLDDNPPGWQDDYEVSSCALCQDKYTIFNRRHHCRKCGRVVCGRCSDQPIKYFPHTYVANSEGWRIRSSPYQTYRTCDECVEEIRMIRRALFNNQGGTNGTVSPAGEAVSRSESVSDGEAVNDNDSTTKYSTTTHTRNLGSSTSSFSEGGRGRHHHSTDSDSNIICPVCASDLLKLYIDDHRKAIDNISNEDFELFKVSHINECLIKFDFNEQHQRLNPNNKTGKSKSHTQNKMLVYNMPPIPKPKFESIPHMEGTSLDTIKLVPRITEEQSSSDIVGSVTSTSTFPQASEKEEHMSLDNECVICLEELKPGDKVGRLECLCVFHYKCIKDWFNKKGFGECPVHYFHS